MGTIAKIKYGDTTHLIASTAYGTCGTAAATVAKVATIQDSAAFTLITGTTIHIKFTYGNTAANPTLNVNNTGAKAIRRYGDTSVGNAIWASWNDGAMVSLTYDGTAWIMNDFYNTYHSIFVKCTTAAGTAAKTASVGNFSVKTGLDIYLTFSNTNTATATPTFSLNGSGAYEIRYKDGVVIRQGLAAGFIYHLVFDGTYWQLINQLALPYATCTVNGNAAKTVTCNGFILYTGATIDILFTKDNTLATTTLNINNTGAKPILWMGLGNTKNNRDTVVDNISYRTLRANHIYRFVYDGTNYRIVDDSLRHMGTSGVTAVAAVTYTQDEYDQYVADNGTAPPWNVGDVKKAAVAAVTGTESLGLGNAVVSNQNGGATGRLLLYGPEKSYHVLQSALTGNSETARTMYIPNYGGDGYLTHTAAATAVGSATKPVYVAANGRVTEGTAYAGGTAVTLNNASKAASTASFYAPAAGGTAGQYLKAAGATSAPTWASFVKPTVTWTGGTTAGPTLKVKTDGGESDAVAIPSASGTASGIVTTGNQSFAGIKTFSNTTASTTTATGAVVVSGGLGVANRVTSKEVNTTNPMVVSAGKVYSNISGSNVILPPKTSMLFSNGLAIAHPGLTAANDVAWIRALGTSESDMVLEIATGDDAGAGEKIVARQYNTSNTVAHEAELLGINGVTSFPVSVTAPIFNGDLNGNATSATKASQDGDGNVFKNTYLKVVAGTPIPASSSAHANLNDLTWQVTGSYSVSATVNVQYVDNMPSDYSSTLGGNQAFMLNVYAPLQSSGTATSGNWLYRIQEIVPYNNQLYTWRRMNSTNGSGTWSFGTWVRRDFTNTAYTHPTTEGNKHIPSGGSSGQFLGWDSAGTAKWVANPNTDTKVNVVARGTTKAYLLADTTAPTSTAAAHTAVAETAVYLDTTAGKLVATSFAGNGSALTNLNGSNIASGTVPIARIPTGTTSSTVALGNHTHNYAGSSSAGGAANSLTNFKVTTSTNLWAVDSPTTNAIGYQSGLTKANWNYQQTDGASYVQWYSANWIHQIFGDYRTGQLSVRSKNNGTWQAWRRILDETNAATILGLGSAAYTASTNYAASDHNHDSAYLKLSGGSLSGRLTMTSGKPINQILTGSGTAATSTTADGTTTYFPAKWTFNTGLTATDGDIYTIKIPVAGHDYGVFMSINNGTNYYPVIQNGTSRITTHYAKDVYIQVIFQSAGSATSIFPLVGGTARATVNGGVFRVLNFYDSGNSMTLRTYSSATNVTVPLIGQSSAGSTTAAWSTYTGTYKDWYGVIPNDDARRAKINLSTGTVTVPGGIAVFNANAGGGTAGYIKICQIVVSETYKNSPIEIVFARRGDLCATRLYIAFENVNGTDPGLRKFGWMGYTNQAFIHKSATSTWDVYIQKTETYDSISITDYHKPLPMDSGVTLTWKNELATALPDGNVQATALGTIETSYNSYMPTGFSARSTNMSWGNQTGAVITGWEDSSGGSIGFRRNNPASGQLSMLVDGTVYIKEGAENVGNAIKSITRSGTTFTYTTLWGTTGTFTQQDNDTKNTAGSTNSDSKLFLIGATSQAANPQTYSDSEVYTTNGTLTAKILSTSAGIHANTANSGTAGGVSLYATNPNNYGLVMRNTGTASGQLGKHGYVQGDWAGYLTFTGAVNRGYIFRHAGANVASVSGEGHAVFNGSVTVGGNDTNTSGVRMTYVSTTESLDFIFA